MLRLSWFIPCLTSCTEQDEGWTGFPLLPLQLLALKFFQVFKCKGRRLQTLVTRPKWAMFHVGGKKHSWNKGQSPPDKLKFLLQNMGLVKASLLGGYPDFLSLFFFLPHSSAFFPDIDH